MSTSSHGHVDGGRAVPAAPHDAPHDSVTTAASGADIVLEPRHLRVTYGRGPGAVTAIGDVSFQVRAGEFVSVVGPSGCGKTTLLKSLSGLLRPTAGDVLVDGAVATGVSPSLAMVFQEYSRSLLPWQSVRANVEFPLRGARLPRAEVTARATEALAHVGLGDVDQAYPWQLSGGMQQRVAIARALAYRPTVLLMDEPFASLDAQVRAELEDLLLDIRAESGMTIVLVTHDIDEAVYLGDRVVALTHRPTEVRTTIDVDLPRSRDQVRTKALPRFVELRTQVLELILAERSASERTGA
ncbi:ABC transporter ATP-binding protein [Pseudonocardia nematodicida]|uniref:ABC transporter ATP-binding protein n=1 Tax=Pseudonocardia nematodicida TaxID=1206997 RepID=A0ABV1KH47_9PSEU